MRAFTTTVIFLLLALTATALRVSPDATAAASGVNWWTAGKVTPPQNQASCNASYAFALASNIESVWALAGHSLRNLSTQEIISCGHGGCSETSGSVAAAMSWILTSNGGTIDTLDSYPFTSYHGNVPLCNDQSGVVGATIVNSKTLASSESTIATYVQTNGPVIARIDPTNLITYTSGVWSGCPATPNPTHAVLIVGYSEGSLPYWIAKNSWGTSWGEGGFFRIPFGSNACGVANSVSTVTATGATLPPTLAPESTQTPSPPIAPPTPMPPSPPVPDTPRPDHHWGTPSPGGHNSQRYKAFVCSDSRCSNCQEKSFYPGECAWETAWSFKAWCDNSTNTGSSGSAAVDLNIFSEAKCGGRYTKKKSYSDYCFSVSGGGGGGGSSSGSSNNNNQKKFQVGSIPSGTHLKIKCPWTGGKN